MFVGYLTGGDGGVDYCVECALKMVEGGVDVLEIGLPFSDPIADGPVIQRASRRALMSGTTGETILKIGEKIRERSDVPLVLFSYYNPLLKKGPSFLEEAKKRGFNSLLVVDNTSKIPSPLEQIFILSPSTSEERIDEILRKARGFLYYACQKGVTGVRNQLPEDFTVKMSYLKKRAQIPIVAGFGIGTRESAQEVLKHADGFVAGSAFVRLMEERKNPETLKELASELSRPF